MAEEALGPDSVAMLRAALELPPAVSVRLNPFKTPSGDPLFPEAEPVPGSEWGRFLPDRPVFTLDPLFHAGAYYVQDSSAMRVGDILRECLKQFDAKDRPLRVLDACAAPGGKTTDAAASLREAFGDRFLLVANEVMRQRAGILKDNVAVWGDPCVAVTSADPAAFKAYEGFFDIILSDVPCSGEGMFRKDEKAIRDWSEDNVALCAARQRRIVSDLWPSLREGGVLIYSTCTFNRRENTENVEWIAKNLGAEIISPGQTLVPGEVRGEGQFVAALRKTSPSVAFRLPKPLRSAIRIPEGLLRGPAVTALRGDAVIAVPEAIAAEAAALESLHPLSVGTNIGSGKGREWIPSADLALSLQARPDAWPSVALSREEALSFLHGDTLRLQDASTGYCIVSWRSLPLGFVKNIGSRCNNLHPKDRRIRMAI